MAKDSPIIAHYKRRNDLLSLLLLLGMSSLLAAIGWLIAEAQGVAIIFLAGMVLLFGCLQNTPRMMLNRHLTRQLTEHEEPLLLYQLEYLSQSAGLNETPGLFVSEQNSLNAFTLKHNDEHIIVLSRTLLETLNQDEIRAVLAHEVSHIYHDDIQLMMLSNRICQITQSLTIIGLVTLAITPILDLQNIPTPWQIIIGLILGNYVSTLMQLSLSRAREFYADVIAVQLTHDVSSMVSALHKIDSSNSTWLTGVLTQNHTQRVSLLRSHPSSQERIRCLLGLDMLSGFTPFSK